MEEKKAFRRLCAYLGGAGVCMAGFAVFIFLIDPFYQYHDTWFGIPAVLENAVYQTPGAARNLPGDSVIVGSSMTENFHASWFDEMGWDTVKLSYSGAHTDDLRAILAQVFERKEPPVNVVMDVNDYQLTTDAKAVYVKRPAYLYDRFLLNDAAYLCNQDVFQMSVQRVADKMNGRESNLDTAYVWEDEALFGSRIARDADRNDRRIALEQGRIDCDPEQMLALCDANLDNLTPLIEAHPETRFYIFYPPYSMLYWELLHLNGTTEEMLAVYRHSIERFLAYDNVRVYYFQAEKEIISDLDNYRDAAHYRPAYNRYIYECIRDGKNLVTREDLAERIADMQRYADTFDYDGLWADDSF